MNKSFTPNYNYVKLVLNNSLRNQFKIVLPSLHLGFLFYALIIFF